MLLSISYSQCLADPTYCDSGRIGGKALTKRFAVKPNEPRPLHEIFRFTTIAEILWCLRAVKPSMRAEADNVARRFTYCTLAEMPAFRDMPDIKDYLFGDTYTMKRSTAVQIDLQHKLTRMYADANNHSAHKQITAMLRALSNDSPSQIAIDVAELGLTVAALNGPDEHEREEQRQRIHLEEMLK